MLGRASLDVSRPRQVASPTTAVLPLVLRAVLDERWGFVLARPRTPLSARPFLHFLAMWQNRTLPSVRFLDLVFIANLVVMLIGASVELFIPRPPAVEHGRRIVKSQARKLVPALP